MSKREDIASDIITQLDAMSSPTLKLITREPYDVEELSDAQFPSAWVSSGSETREDYTLGETTANRAGTIDYVIIGYVKGTTTNIDTKRNELIAGIETTLDADRTRNGNAIDTQIVSVETDEGEAYPHGAIKVVARIFYQFERGTP